MKRLTLLLRLMVTIGLLYVMFSRIHVRAVIASLLVMNPWYIIPLLAISLVMIGISCFKWQIFLRGRQVEVSVLSLVRYYLIGYFFNNFLPGSIGGDVLRGYLLGKDQTGHLHSFSSVFLERLTGLVALLCIGIGALVLNMKLAGESSIVISISIMGALFVSVICFFVFDQCRSVTLYGISKLPARWAAKTARYFSIFYDSIAYFRKHPGILAFSMVYSFGFQFMAVVNTLVCCWALGLHPNPMDVGVVVPIIMLVSVAPISISSIGLWEGAFAYFLTSIGVSAADAVSVALILRAKNLLLGALGGILFALRRTAGLPLQAPSKPS